jgi:hypothetical protein
MGGHTAGMGGRGWEMLIEFQSENLKGTDELGDLAGDL